MRGVTITEPGRIELVGKDPGPLWPGQVRVRLLQGGLCGSDLSAYLGTSPMVTYPRVIGHEVVGAVIQAGEGSQAWVGKTVTVEPYMQCGTCYACRVGRYNCCTGLRVMGVHIDGGLQEEFVVPAHKLVEVPHGMDLDAASLAEPLTISTHAVERSRVARGETVLIFGAGAIGLLALQVVKSYIGARAMVVDVRDDRLDTARRLGAEGVFNVADWSGEGTSPALLDAVSDWTCGEGANVAIEASGHPASSAAALDCLSHAGRLSLVGWNKSPIAIDTVKLMRKELDVYGSRNSAGVFPRALEILAAGHIAISEMVSHKMPLEQAEEGLNIMRDPASKVVKVVLTA